MDMLHHIQELIQLYNKILEKLMLYSGSFVNLDFEYVILACFATVLAVYVISCIRPFAPAELFAEVSNSLSSSNDRK